MPVGSWLILLVLLASLLLSIQLPVPYNLLGVLFSVIGLLVLSGFVESDARNRRKRK